MKTRKTVSQAVMAANQRNAQKSTGPSTDRGKAALRRNALKHGLTAAMAATGGDADDPEYQRESSS